MDYDGELIVAHDVGTSGVKSVLADMSGRLLAKRVVEYPTYFPGPGLAEQDADDWWSAICEGTRAVTAGVPTGAIACVTFSTQMLGLVPLDAGGKVLRRPIIWLDSRAGAEAVSVMRRFGGARLFARLAGAALSGKDGIPKLRWLQTHEPDVWRDMACFVDVGGYLVHRCSGHIGVDWTGASAFGLDLRRKTWLTGIMRYAGIDTEKLPPLASPIEVVGTLTPEAAGDLGLPPSTRVVAGLGDAPAASVGAGAVRDGDAHAYLGTSGWIGVLTHGHPTGRHGIAVIQSGDPQHNLLIAEMETGGECLRWIADELYRAKERPPGAEDVFQVLDRDAATVPAGAGALLFMPWMFGERVPVNDLYVRSGFLNIGPAHTRQSLARAVLEGVAYNFRWSLERLDDDFQRAPAELRVVGGGARSPIWMQILADVTQRRVETVQDPQDAGAVGAALAAGVALGVHPDFAALRGLVRVAASYEPAPESKGVYDFLFDQYRDAYRRLRGLYRRLNGSAPPGQEPPSAAAA